MQGEAFIRAVRSASILVFCVLLIQANLFALGPENGTAVLEHPSETPEGKSEPSLMEKIRGLGERSQVESASHYSDSENLMRQWILERSLQLLEDALTKGIISEKDLFYSSHQDLNSETLSAFAILQPTIREMIARDPQFLGQLESFYSNGIKKTGFDTRNSERRRFALLRMADAQSIMLAAVALGIESQSEVESMGHQLATRHGNQNLLVENPMVLIRKAGFTALSSGRVDAFWLRAPFFESNSSSPEASLRDENYVDGLRINSIPTSSLRLIDVLSQDVERKSVTQKIAEEMNWPEELKALAPEEKQKYLEPFNSRISKVTEFGEYFDALNVPNVSKRPSGWNKETAQKVFDAVTAQVELTYSKQKNLFESKEEKQQRLLEERNELNKSRLVDGFEDETSRNFELNPEVDLDSQVGPDQRVVDQEAFLTNRVVFYILAHPKVTLDWQLPEGSDPQFRSVAAGYFMEIFRDHLGEDFHDDRLEQHRERFLRLAKEARGRKLTRAERSELIEIHSRVLALAATQSAPIYKVVQSLPAEDLVVLSGLGWVPGGPEDPKNKIFNSWYGGNPKDGLIQKTEEVDVESEPLPGKKKTAVPTVDARNLSTADIQVILKHAPVPKTPESRRRDPQNFSGSRITDPTKIKELIGRRAGFESGTSEIKSALPDYFQPHPDWTTDDIVVPDGEDRDRFIERVMRYIGTGIYIRGDGHFHDAAPLWSREDIEEAVQNDLYDILERAGWAADVKDSNLMMTNRVMALLKIALDHNLIKIPYMMAEDSPHKFSRRLFKISMDQIKSQKNAVLASPEMRGQLASWFSQAKRILNQNRRIEMSDREVREFLSSVQTVTWANIAAGYRFMRFRYVFDEIKATPAQIALAAEMGMHPEDGVMGHRLFENIGQYSETSDLDIFDPQFSAQETTDSVTADRTALVRLERNLRNEIRGSEYIHSRPEDDIKDPYLAMAEYVLHEFQTAVASSGFQLPRVEPNSQAWTLETLHQAIRKLGERDTGFEFFRAQRDSLVREAEEAMAIEGPHNQRIYLDEAAVKSLMTNFLSRIWAYYIVHPQPEPTLDMVYREIHMTAQERKLLNLIGMRRKDNAGNLRGISWLPKLKDWMLPATQAGANFDIPYAESSNAEYLWKKLFLRVAGEIPPKASFEILWESPNISAEELAEVVSKRQNKPVHLKDAQRWLSTSRVIRLMIGLDPSENLDMMNLTPDRVATEFHRIYGYQMDFQSIVRGIRFLREESTGKSRTPIKCKDVLPRFAGN